MADNTYNLSIIAVRILPHCRDSVRKCLREDVLYYLNMGYDISDDGKAISLLDEGSGMIGNSFFNQGEIFRETDEKPIIYPMHNEEKSWEKQNFDSGPNISISAIVGKNGDGKSSLVELMIRILNNFACRKGLDPYGHLIYVKEVYGEVYYKHDNRFFRIRMDKGEGDDAVEIHEYLPDDESNMYILADNELEEKDIRGEAAFYMLVSNYSHFAYNTEDFKDESISDDEENHWLHRLFHKNDAYQTPINLHPYRDKGTISINKERLLSTQRVLMAIAGSLKRSKHGNLVTDLEENGKIPHELRLWDAGKSKLQENTLRSFFEDNKNARILDDQVKMVKNAALKPEDKLTGDGLFGDLVGTSLTAFTRTYFRQDFKQYLKGAIRWLKKNNLLSEKSDLGDLLKDVTFLNEKIKPMSYYISDEDLNVWKSYSQLSALQFLRLVLVYDICRIWKKPGEKFDNAHISKWFKPSTIFKSYDSLSCEEKCVHYIIYKTIEIFKAYPSYSNPIKEYANSDVFFSFRGSQQGTLIDLRPVFKKLSEDWRLQSHNTLKLRQTYNLLRGRNTTKEMYGSIDRDKGRTFVFGELDQNSIATLSSIETLPPPIYKWEIWFNKEKEDKLIPFNSFSSGEKQKQFFQSAIIYHLQNISSVGKEPIHYHSVNLIFEEIELYFHPEWQRRLIFDLMKAIRSANIPEIKSINMIFVTHSPYILSDIPKKNVLFLRDGAPTYEMQENTFGANINSLLKNGFFLPSLPMGEFAYRKINSLFAMLHGGGVNSENFDEVYSQIMTVGEPAIRMQMMTLLAPYKRLIVYEKEGREDKHKSFNR